jgi:hypothetical protein
MRVAIYIAMMAKTPVHQGQQYHRYEGNNTIAMSQGQLCINDDNNAIATRATMPA